jgi:hypothetical protein
LIHKSARLPLRPAKPGLTTLLPSNTANELHHEPYHAIFNRRLNRRDTLCGFFVGAE